MNIFLNLPASEENNKRFNELLDFCQKYKQEKETIELNDTVSYDDNEYLVEYVWNHGTNAIWYDLIATKPAIEGVNYLRAEKSVPSYDCKLIKKNDNKQ